MAKGTRGRRRIFSRQCRPTPYPLASCNPKKCSKTLEKKDWIDATCSVCMEYPHNAVLLLCSSHDKGCRPYMCGTSVRYSNCLDQYKKANAKVTSPLQNQPSSHGPEDDLNVGPVENCEVTLLACPLCRGQVKGWTVVEPAREYLNAKNRSCTQDNCPFAGTYKELRKHVRADHPCARPREVDPALEQKWRRLERELERDDVVSTIRSSMPGAVVFGDYVLEGSHYEFDSDEEEDAFDVDVTDRNQGFEMGIDRNLVNMFLLLHAFGPGGNAGQNRGTRQHERESDQNSDGGGGGVGFRQTSPVVVYDSSDQENDDHDDDDGGGDSGGLSLVHRLRRQGRILLGRSGRRRRRREAGAGGGQRES